MSKQKNNSLKRKLVRHSDKPYSKMQKNLLSCFRFLIYGMLGVFSEVCLYSIVKLGRTLPLISWIFNFQWRVDDKLNLNNIWQTPIKTLFGQCSLWMFFVYGLCGFFIIEKLYRKLYNTSWIYRGMLYACSILLAELITGFMLLYITGYKIWYYNDSLNILHMTSLYTLPMWFITGMLVETVYRELMPKEILKSIQKELDKAFTAIKIEL